jgi:hypothetical protein
MSSGYVSVEIFEARGLRKRRDPQPLAEAGVLAFGELVLQEHRETFLEAQGAGVWIGELAFEGAEHAGEFEFIEQLQQRFDQHRCFSLGWLLEVIGAAHVRVCPEP